MHKPKMGLDTLAFFWYSVGSILRLFGGLFSPPGRTLTMKKIKKWHVVLGAIVAILVVSRIITGKPIVPAISEMVSGINFSALLEVLIGMSTRVSTIDFVIVIVGLLPAILAYAYKTEHQTVNWRTRSGNLRWRQTQRLQKQCREKYSAPAFVIAFVTLILRQDVFCLILLIVGAIFVWGIDSGKVQLKKEK